MKRLFGLSVVTWLSLALVGCRDQPGQVHPTAGWREPPAQALGLPTTRPAAADVSAQLMGPDGRAPALDPARLKVIRLAVDGSAADVAAGLTRYGVQVILRREDQAVPVRLRVDGKAIDDVLSLLAANISQTAQVFQRQGYVFVGPPSERDRASRAFYVPDGEGGEWISAYKLGASSDAEVTSVGDRVVVRDSLVGLRRVEAIHDSLSQSRKQYVLECVFLECTESELSELGIKVTADGAATLTATVGDVPVASGLTLQATIASILRANKRRDSGIKMDQLRLHVVEGVETEEHSGDVIAVPRRVVSPYGTTVTNGYDTFNTGLDLRCRARTVADGFVRLDLTCEVAALRGFNGDYPTINTRRFASSAFVGSGGIIVVGGQSIWDHSDGRDVLPGTDIDTNRRDSFDRGRLYLFLRLKEM